MSDNIVQFPDLAERLGKDFGPDIEHIGSLIMSLAEGLVQSSSSTLLTGAEETRQLTIIAASADIAAILAESFITKANALAGTDLAFKDFCERVHLV